MTNGPLNLPSPRYEKNGYKMVEIDTKDTKWFIRVADSQIFNERYNTSDLSKLGGIEQVEKELDKNVLKIKSLVNKTCDLSKFFCTMKVTIFIIHFIQN